MIEEHYRALEASILSAKDCLSYMLQGVKGKEELFLASMVLVLLLLTVSSSRTFVISQGTSGGYSFPFDLHVKRMSIIGHTVRNKICKGGI